ncbi:MAG TPA: helix-turn-helix transcriptional regulator [Clostridiales bacterium]|nr:helix-turn-helix transcriptional regulator [Clostridiales bacterium]
MLNLSAGKNISKSRVIFTYFITYLIIITVLFLVIGSFSYSKLIKTEREKARMELEQTVNRVVEVMDTNLRDVITLQSSFYIDTDVSRLRKLDANFKPKEFMRFLGVSEKLSKYTSTSQFLDRITLYFHYNQLFIASDMLDSRPEVFYKLKFPEEKVSYKQWRNEVMKHKSSVFYVKGDSNDGYVNLYYRLPILDPLKGVTIITGIKVGELIKSLGVNELYNDSALVITDSEGNILYSSSDSAKELINLAESTGESPYTTLDGYEWSSKKLYLLNWKVSYFVSRDDIYTNSRRTRTSILGLYSLVLVSSLILAMLFSKKMSDPVESLLNLVNRWGKHNRLAENISENRGIFSYNNYLYYVLRRVSDMSNDYMQLRTRFAEYQKTSREAFYNRLLKGEVISEDELRTIEEDSILNFKYYTVAIARLISYDSKSINVAMFAASETFSSMREGGYYFCKTAYDRFTVIICRNSYSDRKEIENAIEFLMSNINFDPLVSVRWGIGDTVLTYDQIFVSYRNAELALHNMNVLDSDVILWYSNIDKNKNQLTYNFEDAQRIYSLICNGNSEAAVQTIRKLVDRNREVLQASKGQRARFISMISETILLSVSKFASLDNQLENEIEQVLRVMKRAESIDSIINCISLAISKLSSFVNTRNNSNNQRLVAKIKKYIDENYSDPNLSLTSIALSMRLSESYISGFFKQNNGINIQHYIEQKRMTKAVELLTKTDLAIAEVVNLIGYNNINTFYKAFKRCYKMTPKECRESGNIACRIDNIANQA